MVLRILIVGSDTQARISLATTFTSRGCVVVEAAAAAAVRTAKASEPDLILLDLDLPERDGVNVLEALRKSHPDLVLTSSVVGTRIKHCALRLGP